MRKIIIIAIIALISAALALQPDFKKNGYVQEQIQISNSAATGLYLGSVRNTDRSLPDITETMQGALVNSPQQSYLNQPEMPVLPQEIKSITISGNYRVTGVVVREGSVSAAEINSTVVKTSPRVTWRQQPNLPSSNCNQSYFPGKWAAFNSGFDGKNTQINIQIYTAQYSENEHKLLVLNNYVADIYGEPVNLQVQSPKFRLSNATHIIISPAEWQLTADSLAALHNQQGSNSEVVTLEAICGQYQPAEDPVVSGYANATNTSIHDYAFEKAKKIIAYLRNQAAHPNLTDITILGDGKVIPPAYYFYNETSTDPSATYEEWVPSDHYYASPDYDWVCNFGVNRLSLTSASQLSAYVHKLNNWMTNLNGDWLLKASVEGGNPFDSQYFIGEMINNQVTCANYFNGFQVDKYHLSNNKFNRTSVMNHLTNDDFLFHLNIAHGSGSAVYYDNGTSLSGQTVAAFPAKDKLPVYISISCDNGAFDTRLYNGFGSTSYAEYITRSKGAAICYVGGSRSNGGMPLFTIQNGNLHYHGTDDTYTLITGYLKSYRSQSNPTFGSLLKGAKDYFLTVSDMNNPWNLTAYVRFVQHGSAGTKLPVAPSINSETTVPVISLINGTNNQWFQYRELSTGENANYSISDNESYNTTSVSFTTDSTSAYQFIKNYQTLSLPDVAGNFTLDNSPRNKFVLNKLSNSEYKEAWHYSYLKSSTDINADNLVKRFNLSQNYPNPFNPLTSINYEIKNATNVNLSVYNAKGELAKTLVNCMQNSGHHNVVFDASMLNSGVYFYKLEAEGISLVNKMILCK